MSTKPSTTFETVINDLGIGALNTNERKVLHAVLEAASANGYDFTFGDEVQVPKMGRRALGAYLADLQTKKFLYLETDMEVNGTNLGTCQVCWDGPLQDFIQNYEGDLGQFVDSVKVES